MPSQTETRPTAPRLRGLAAIAYAEEHELTLCAHADPTSAARFGVLLDEARKVAAEDPSLVWIDRSVSVALVGDDGVRPVIYGIGDTLAQAREDATDYLDAGIDDLVAHKIDEAQRAIVVEGDVAWPVIVPTVAWSASDFGSAS